MSPSIPRPPQQIVYQNAPAQPSREDAEIAKARQDELRRQAAEQGRAATLIVGKSAYGPEKMLPSGPGGASMLGV